MPHGLPDDADVESIANVYKSLDVAELAVRLGGIPSFDRRGDVVYLNDFRAGAGILTLSESVGSTELLFSDYNALLSGVSVLMYVSGVEDDYATAQGRVLLDQAGGIGVEFLYTVLSHVKSVSLRIQIITGGLCYYFWIDIVITTGKVYYYDAAGAWVEIGEHTATNPQSPWLQSAKLVIDRDSLQYARFIYNGVVYLLRDLAPFVFASATNDQLFFEGRYRADDTGACTAYLAGVIVTQNEPL